jgi:anhydro-N-acetylmuramic acid kinase
MTSAITFPGWVIGLMSGTSMDGVDAALLYTDGENIVKTGAALTLPYDEALRRATFVLMRGQGGDKAAIAHAITQRHREAVEALIAQSGLARAEIKLIGFHGQTIRHVPHEGITEQIGDAAWLAAETGIPVVADFRSNDVKHGGQGAPLVPLYHAALAHALPKPVMVVNIGGVANVTWIGQGDANLIAFDCGPGNALMDDWMRQHTGAAYDANGATAARGRVDKARVVAFLGDEFFALPAPKSLDRHHFGLKLVGGLNLEDGAATLAAMTTAAIAASLAHVPAAPQQWLVTGGGRHNATLMLMLKEAVTTVVPVESVGWDGDALEAEAFAYLAVRSAKGLPLTLASTTGVSRPVSGGVFYPASGADGS